MRLSWPFHIYRVSGTSMLPTYQPEDTLLGFRWFTPRIGQVVVLSHLGRSIIKRITKIDGSAIWVEGDNGPKSTDSRNFGYVDRSEVEARIIAHIS